MEKVPGSRDVRYDISRVSRSHICFHFKILTTWDGIIRKSCLYARKGMYQNPITNFIKNYSNVKKLIKHLIKGLEYDKSSKKCLDKTAMS